MDGKRRANPRLYVALSLVLSVMLLASYLCLGTALAESDGDIGALDGKGYGSLSSLASDLENNYEGKSVTIDMYRDLEAAYEHSEYDVRL